MKYQDLEPKKKPSRTATSLKAGIRNADTGEPEQITTWTVCGSVCWWRPFNAEKG